MPQQDGAPPVAELTLVTDCLGLKHLLIPFTPPSSLLPSVCTDPAIKPSHSEGKGPLYCIEMIKQQMTYTWEVLQLHFTSQEMLHSHKMLHTGELRLLVFNPLPCWASVSKDGLGSLTSLELRAS